MDAAAGASSTTSPRCAAAAASRTASGITASVSAVSTSKTRDGGRVSRKTLNHGLTVYADDHRGRAAALRAVRRAGRCPRPSAGRRRSTPPNRRSSARHWRRAGSSPSSRPPRAPRRRTRPARCGGGRCGTSRVPARTASASAPAASASARSRQHVLHHVGRREPGLLQLAMGGQLDRRAVPVGHERTIDHEVLDDADVTGSRRVQAEPDRDASFDDVGLLDEPAGLGVRAVVDARDRRVRVDDGLGRRVRLRGRRASPGDRRRCSGTRSRWGAGHPALSVGTQCSWKLDSSTTSTSNPAGSRIASSTGTPMLPDGGDPAARLLQEVRRQLHRRGLAVRAGDADPFGRAHLVAQAPGELDVAPDRDALRDGPAQDGVIRPVPGRDDHQLGVELLELRGTAAVRRLLHEPAADHVEQLPPLRGRARRRRPAPRHRARPACRRPRSPSRRGRAPLPGARSSRRASWSAGRSGACVSGRSIRGRTSQPPPRRTGRR